MATNVDRSLDDLIQKNRMGGRGQGRPRRGRRPNGSFRGGRMTGAPHRGPLSVNSRPSQYSIAKPPRRVRSLPWKPDLLEDSIRAAGITGIEVGTKLYVSNLDFGVTNEDIRELFSEIGDLKRYAIHYDKTGRPSGSAEVVYTRRSDAFKALRKYNDVLLDGKPMKIEVLGTNMDVPVTARVNVTGMNGRKKRTVVMTPVPGRASAPAVTNRASGQSRRGGLRNGNRGRGRGSGSGSGGGSGSTSGSGGGSGSTSGRGRGRARGRGRGRGKKQPIDKSADELDKELDNYHAKANNNQAEPMAS